MKFLEVKGVKLISKKAQQTINGGGPYGGGGPCYRRYGEICICLVDTSRCWLTCERNGCY